MNRILLTRMVVACATLAILLPFLPAEDKNNPLGLGGFQRALNINRRLAEHPPDSAARNARIRYPGRLRPAQVRKLLERIEQVRVEEGAAAAQREAGTVNREGSAESPAPNRAAPVCVQARGFLRNEFWTLSYDFYPIRVIGSFMEEGGRAHDPVLPEADWVLTVTQNALELERVP
jgi:hypothetical protein